MSFVSRLRMANMFPVNTDIGQASVDLSGPDPMMEVLGLVSRLRGQNRPSPGIQQVARQAAPQPQPQQSTLASPLKFGGVVGGDSNPGAGILNRATANAERIWNDYKQPLNPITPGPSNDTIDYQRFLDNSFKQQKVNADIEDKRRNDKLAQERVDNSKAAADNRGWDVVNVPDPNQPNVPRSMLLNKFTGEMKPIAGNITPAPKPKDMQADIDKRNAEIKGGQAMKAHAQQILNLIDQLSTKTNRTDPTNNNLPIEELSPEMHWNTGRTSYIPDFVKNFVNPETATAMSNVKQLKSLLALDKLMQLRGQTKTGASPLGSNVNQNEFATVGQSASRLDTLNQSDEGYAQELAKIRDKFTQIYNEPIDEPLSADQGTGEIPIGTLKTFPNGRQGKWDGQGWEMVK